MYRWYVLLSFVLLPVNVVYGLPYSKSRYMPAFGVLLQLVGDNDNYMRITWGLGGTQRGAIALWILNLQFKF